jgi:thiamine kinase-like enzyme
MKTELKFIIENLNPKLLGVDKVSIDSFKKLGVGEGNLNYLFKIKNNKFICRVNIDKGVPNKSKNEFESLKRVESLNIAPKAFYYHPKDKKFPYGFIILEFIEGKPLRMKKRTYTKKQVKQIAFILAELHSKNCNGLPKKDYSFQYYLKHCEDYNKTINKHNDKLKKELIEIKYRIGNFLSKKEEHKFSLIHGDVCPQNIVETKNGLKLIDWESLQCSDPAKDIANILIDLELKNSDLDLFLKEYQKIRKDPTILKRAKTYAVLLRAVYFLWEITRSFEIINKELPKEYLNKTTAQSHINEAKFQFRRLSELIDVPKINIDSLFTGAKN